MSVQSSTEDTADSKTLTTRQLSAIKVVKYLFFSSLVLLIIGAFVLFCTAIDTIVSTNEDIDATERFGVSELATKRNERLKQQRLLSTFSLIINSLIILLSSFGIIFLIRNHFLLIVLFGIFNTTVLLVSLWSTTGKAAIVLLQIIVSLFAFSYTLSIYYQLKVELKKRQKNRKEVKNNAKTNGIEVNHKSDYVIEENGITYENYNNNPDLEATKDLKELNGILV